MEEHTTFVLRELFTEIRKLLPKPCEGMPRFENVGQASVMLYLIDHDGETITQKDIEIYTHRSKATISGILDTLEKRQMIVRVSSNRDRRKKIVCITDEMRSYVEPVKRQFFEVEQLLAQDIPQEDLDTFYRVASQMIQNIRKEL